VVLAGDKALSRLVRNALLTEGDLVVLPLVLPPVVGLMELPEPLEAEPPLAVADFVLSM
jgi:hypothetical protein